jgi:hypothetical protein
MIATRETVELCHSLDPKRNEMPRQFVNWLVAGKRRGRLDPETA